MIFQNLTIMKLSYKLFSVALLTIATSSQAQIRKGTLMLGGSIHYSSEKQEVVNVTEKVEEHTSSIGPSVGYAFKDNLVAGIDLRYESIKKELHFDNKTNGFSGLIFLRKYWNITSRFYAFAHADAGYGSTTGHEYASDGITKTATTKGWNAGASLIPGISYAVGKKVHLESTFLPLLQVQYQKTERERFNPGSPSFIDTREEFGMLSSLGNGQTFSLGVRFMLGK